MYVFEWVLPSLAKRGLTRQTQQVDVHAAQTWYTLHDGIVLSVHDGAAHCWTWKPALKRFSASFMEKHALKHFHNPYNPVSGTITRLCFEFSTMPQVEFSRPGNKLFNGVVRLKCTMRMWNLSCGLSELTLSKQLKRLKRLFSRRRRQQNSIETRQVRLVCGNDQSERNTTDGKLKFESEKCCFKTFKWKRLRVRRCLLGMAVLLHQKIVRSTTSPPAETITTMDVYPMQILVLFDLPDTANASACF